MKRRIFRSVAGIMVILIVCLTARITQMKVAGQYEARIEAMTDFTVSEEDDIEQFRRERQQLRQMQKAELNDLVYNSGAEDEIIVQARQRLIEIMQTEETELILEGIIRLRGYSEPVVSVNGESINVLVRAQQLTQQETAVILELIMRETGISGGNVKIIPIK